MNTLDLSEASVGNLFVHRVGNKLREEPLVLSDTASPVTDELSAMLLQGYLKGIVSERNEYYFHHETDLTLNETRFYANQFFRGEVDFSGVAQRFATHLYENSLHPNIRRGDLLVILFQDITYKSRKQNAIGLFKSEELESYFTVTEGAGTLKLSSSVGINPNLIDKGALIFEQGDVVLAVDRFGKRTKFWLDDFLKVKKYADASTCGKIMSFIAGKIAGTIENPVERNRYQESIEDLCSSNESITAKTLAAASKDYIDATFYDATVVQAQRKFGVDELGEAAAPSQALQRALSRKISKLNLGYDVSLLLPPEMKLRDFKVTKEANGELVISLILGKHYER